MKKILEKILANLAKEILQKYQPKVVGITGSIGKTSAKEAVFAVLEKKFNARQNIKNYNNELGVPLTIIGEEAGGRSITKWFNVWRKAKRLIKSKDSEYPEVLVLEMGADKPGDIEYLVDIAPCFVGVLTTVGPTHLEAFGTVENVAKEKQKIVTHLDKTGFAILNYDDEIVRAMADNTKAKVVFYGQTDKAQIYALDLFNQGLTMDLEGIKFKITDGKSSVPVFLPGVVGVHQINCALIAAAVGHSFGMNLVEIADGLKNYHAPKGRMNLIEGADETLLIDDTYNSSPKAAIAALEALSTLKLSAVERKGAILGDMLELGAYTDEAHFNLGKKAAELKLDFLVCVGINREKMAEGALKNGLSEEQLFKFENSELAGQNGKELLKSKDLILIKGSQGSRMEKVVKSLMKYPERAGDLLVRQSADWLS
jgi:UDP-N-acetylmuramoyl-tripeptide--D-alanyl-D-alanine ligase